MSRWLACELHDAVVQNLTINLVGLEELKRNNAHAPEMVRQLDSQQMLTRAALSNLRGLLCDLRGQSRDTNDLIASFGAILSRAEERYGPRTCLDIRSTVWATLPRHMAHNLQRILEEAVCNACRHSGASLIRVVVEDRAGNLELSIHDNGLGFRGVLAPQEGMGMGIQGMRERAALMGGRLEVESAPGGGTVVRAQVPSPAAANAA